MSGSDDYNVAQKLKRELKKWETEFVTEHKRKPKKEDIDASPQGIQETYRSYNKLKKQIQERIDKKKENKDENRDQIRNEDQNDEKSPKTDQIRNENQNDEKSPKTDQIRNKNQNDEKSPKTDQIRNKNQNDEKSPKTDQIRNKNQNYEKSTKTDQIRNENQNDEKSPKTDQIRNKNQNDEKSPITADGKTEKKIKKDSPKDTGNVDDDSIGNESEVWGRQFDRKNVKEKRSTSSETEGKKSNQYLQKLSSKLFDVSKQIGDVKPSYRRSKPLIIPKETCNASKQKSDIYDYSCDDKNSEFKIKNKLFEKAVSLTSKKYALTDTDTEEVILPDKFIVKSKPKSSQGDYQNNFEAGKLDKNYMSTDSNWDEIDHMTPFADESHKSDVQEEAIYDNIQTAKSYKKQDSSPVDIYSKNKNVQEVDIEEPMEIDDDSYNNKRRIRKPIIGTKSLAGNVDNDDVVVKETGDKTLESKYDFSGEDDVPVIPKHGKRKAEKSQEGQSKKRKIKVIENRDLGDETNTETEVKEPPKPKKPCAPSRNKAPSSYAKSDNFVRLNMKVKTYRRKGSQGKTGPQMKRFLWKQKMKSRSESYGNKCFKCGQEGHWANKCKGGAKEKEEMDDQPPVLEENFPTLRQASMMAKGIKTNGQKDKVKVPKTSKQNEDSKVKEKEKIDDDLEEFDIEAGIVRTTREIQEAPPPMEPFFSLEEENSEDIPDSVKKGLKQFGYDKFRHGQEKAVKRILSGHSTLVILSTGGGKSLTYQLPAILYAQKSNCFTLVISPLVSLMEDQITDLPPGVRGACLHTNMSKAQRESVMQSLKDGQVHFLLVSPEAIAGGTMSFLNSASSLPPISFVCIDEAHCLSEWSHNFRPSYLRLTKVIREKFGVQCFLGLTATATQSTAANVAKHLGIDNLEEAVVRGPPVPKNLFLSVSRDENREEALIGILQGDRFSQCESIIVYCTRRQTTDRLATLIRTSLQDKKGENWTGDRTKRKGGKKQYNYWDSESYHAGLSAAARKRVQNAFMSGRLRVVVATVAFGMGLDKSNVRGVIHYNMPKSFESYVQEIGRAGRDGKPSHCHVFLDSEGKDLSELRRHTYSNTVDYRTLKKFIQRVFTPCKCREVHSRHKEAVKESTNNTDTNDTEGAELFDDWDGVDTVTTTTRMCPGHERAIPIETLVMDLDVKEEGIATLFCYLELHPNETWKVENLTNVYSTCNVNCYGGPALLQEVAKKCPPVAVAIAKAKKDGKSFANKASVEFPVVDISDCMGWDSGPVKRELKMLMWNMNGGDGPRRSSVIVEFTDLAFHFRAPGDLTEDEMDDVIMTLHSRIQAQEKSELANLKYLSNTLQSVSHKNYWMCADDLDEKKNAKLKVILEDYFHDQTDFKAVVENTEEEISSYELSQVRSDMRQFINLYSQEHKLNGRAIARIFHGIGSPCFPANTWGRVRKFWRSNINVDFNILIKLATRELINMR